VEVGSRVGDSSRHDREENKDILESRQENRDIYREIIILIFCTKYILVTCLIYIGPYMYIYIRDMLRVLFFYISHMSFL
jgi:hypothetical protein